MKHHIPGYRIIIWVQRRSRSELSRRVYGEGCRVPECISGKPNRIILFLSSVLIREVRYLMLINCFYSIIFS